MENQTEQTKQTNPEVQNQPPKLASKGDAFRSYRKTNIFRNKFFLGFIALSFLIAFLVGGFVLGKNSTNKQVSQTTTVMQTPFPSPTPITFNNISFEKFCKFATCPTNKSSKIADSDLKTYENQSFTFKYPKDWTVDTSKSESNLITILKTTIGRNASGNITNYTSKIEIYFPFTTVFLEDLFKQRYADTELQAYNDDIINSAKKAYLDGSEAIFIQNSYGIGGFDGDGIVTIHNSLGYNIGLKQADDSSAEALYIVLSTFKFTNAVSGTGVSGKIALSPTCAGAQQAGESCTKPYKATVIVKNKTTGKEVTRFTSDASGNFSVSLTPGSYTLEPISTGTYPVGKPQDVVVTQNKVTDVIITYDTGIR